MKKKKIFIIIILILLVLICVLVVCGNKRSDSKKTAEMYIEACFEGDAETLVELIPESYFEMSDETKEELIRSYEEYMSGYVNRLKFIDENWEYTYTITGVTDMDDERIKKWNEKAEENNNDLITEGKYIEISALIKVNGKVIDIEARDIIVFKIGNKWYSVDDDLPYDIKTAVEDLE